MKTHSIVLYGSAMLSMAAFTAKASPDVVPPPVSPTANIETLPQLIKEAEKGVFFLRVLDEDHRVIATGTGFLVITKGAVLTSLHVIRPSFSPKPSVAVEAIDASGKTFKVKGVIRDDESLDLALLELEEIPTDAVPIAMAGDEPPERGVRVLVLGHPQGMRFVSTDGIVSAVSKTRELPEIFSEGGNVQAGPEVIWLQTSASVSTGSSGGPMLDAEGKAIGVIQWMARGSGMNFALHISAVKGFLAKPPHEPVSVAEFSRPEANFRELLQQFQRDHQGYLNSLQLVKFNRDKRPEATPAPVVEHPGKKHFPAMLEFAVANRGRDVELRALATMMMIAGGRGCSDELGPEVKRAADLLIAGYRDDRKILPLLRCRNAPTMPEAREFLRILAGTSTDREIRALAAFSLAEALETDGLPAREEALKLAQAAVSADPEIRIGSDLLTNLAKELVEKLTTSVAGCSAPDLTGKDRDGKEIKLTDYRGRHVVVVFWGGYGNFTNDVDRFLNETARVYAESPLEIIGIKLSVPGSSPLLPVQQKPDAGWTALSEKTDSPLAKAWHISAHATAFVIDPYGMILCRYADLPSQSIMMGRCFSPVPSSFGFYSAFNSMTDGSWKAKVTKQLDAIPAIFEEKDKLKRLLMSGPWLALNDWKGGGEHTVFLRENGTTSVDWITKWQCKPPFKLHLHVKDVGCVDLDFDQKTNEAKVTSPPALANRVLKLRDSAQPPIVESEQMMKVRECLLKESWNWFSNGGGGDEKPYTKFRFLPDGTTTSELVPAWELLPSAQIRIYVHTGKYWVFDFDLATKSAHSNLKDGQIRDNKAIVARTDEEPIKH